MITNFQKFFQSSTVLPFTVDDQNLVV